MDRQPLWYSLAFGLAAGAAGAVWILADYSAKAYNLAYHVPLAIIFTSALVDATFDAFQNRRFGFHYACGLAGALLAGRIVKDWPISGHGILGVLLAFSPIRPIWRVAGALVAVQALVTKVVIGEPWLAAIWGAAVGGAMAVLARALDRRAERTTSVPA
jgi:hypothetical protein